MLWGCKRGTTWKQPQSTQSRWRANTYLVLQRLNFCNRTVCFGHRTTPQKENAAAMIFPQCCRWHQLYWVKSSTSNMDKSFLINRNWKSLQHQNSVKDWTLLGKIHGICLAKSLPAIKHYNCRTLSFIPNAIHKWCSHVMWHSFFCFWKKSRSSSAAATEHRVTSTTLQEDTEIFIIWSVALQR